MGIHFALQTSIVTSSPQLTKTVVIRTAKTMPCDYVLLATELVATDKERAYKLFGTSEKESSFGIVDKATFRVARDASNAGRDRQVMSFNESRTSFSIEALQLNRLQSSDLPQPEIPQKLKTTKLKFEGNSAVLRCACDQMLIASEENAEHCSQCSDSPIVSP